MWRSSYIVCQRIEHYGAGLGRLLEQLRQAGYDGVELNLTEPLGLPAEKLRRMVADEGLVVPSFLTGEAYFDELCLSSPHAQTRRAAVDRLGRYVEIAASFNAILVIGMLQGLRKDEPHTEVANARIADCLAEVADVATRHAVQLVLEPVNHLQVGFNNTVAEVRSMVQRVGSPALRPMVDTLHMNIEEHSLPQAIVDCGRELRHVHLCDSNGKRFGSGHVDFPSVLAALDEIEYGGWVSLKIYRDEEPVEAARLSLEYVRQLYLEKAAL